MTQPQDGQGHDAAPAPVQAPIAAPVVIAPKGVDAPHHGGGFIGAIKRVGGFLWWLVTGFGLVGLIRRKKSSLKTDEIVVYTIHRSFYLWAMILCGFLGSAFVNHYHRRVETDARAAAVIVAPAPDNAQAPAPAPTPAQQQLVAAHIASSERAAHIWGWIYLWVLVYTLTLLLFDISAMKFVLWTGVFCFIWLACKYLEDLKHVMILSYVVNYLRALRPRLDAGFATMMSWILIIPWIGAMFHSFSRGRKSFSPNSIEEWYLGEGREVTDRSGLKFRSRYRDLLEMILGLGAGDLEAVDNNQVVVKRWENILFLAFVWNKLDEILHQRAAVVENTKEDPVEVEEAKK